MSGRECLDHANNVRRPILQRLGVGACHVLSHRAMTLHDLATGSLVECSPPLVHYHLNLSPMVIRLPLLRLSTYTFSNCKI